SCARSTRQRRDSPTPRTVFSWRCAQTEPDAEDRPRGSPVAPPRATAQQSAVQTPEPQRAEAVPKAALRAPQSASPPLRPRRSARALRPARRSPGAFWAAPPASPGRAATEKSASRAPARSEEHTSELQSRENLV